MENLENPYYKAKKERKYAEPTKKMKRSRRIIRPEFYIQKVQKPLCQPAPAIFCLSVHSPAVRYLNFTDLKAVHRYYGRYKPMHLAKQLNAIYCLFLVRLERAAKIVYFYFSEPACDPI